MAPLPPHARRRQVLDALQRGAFQTECIKAELGCKCTGHENLQLALGCMQARASLGVLYQPFWYLLVVVALMEAFSGPVSIMADTAIVAAALDSGDYGRCAACTPRRRRRLHGKRAATGL